MAVKVKTRRKPKAAPTKTVNFKVKKKGEKRSYPWLLAKANRYTRGNMTELVLRAVESYPNKARRHDGEKFRATSRK